MSREEHQQEVKIGLKLFVFPMVRTAVTSIPSRTTNQDWVSPFYLFPSTTTRLMVIHTYQLASHHY